MSKQKTARNSRKGGGKKQAPREANANRSGSTEGRTPRRTTAALRSKVTKAAKATGPKSAEKRHAGIRRS